MSATKSSLIAAVALLTVLALASARMSACAPQQQDDQGRVQLPPLFDFGNFKRQFKRSYSGLLEELARKKYYFPRAMRVVVTAMKYKFNQLSYYLAVNLLSDSSPQELDRMRNRRLEEFTSSELVAPAPAPANKLAELVPGGKHENADQELAVGGGGRPTRKKRSAPEVGDETGKTKEKKKLRELPLDRLINTGDEVELPVETKRKIKARLPREQMNPNYEKLELPSFGIIDQQEPVTWWYLSPKPEFLQAQQAQQAKFQSSVAEKLMDELEQVSDMDIDSGPEAEVTGVTVPEDVVWVDLRSTNCFFLPRNQGKCGSCYAFATIAIMEWIHCMRYGQLVAFSEQYIVDCSLVAGPLYTSTQKMGCQGGDPETVANFINNFGLELRVNYPYRERELVCPYTPETDLKSTGVWRTELKHAIQVNESLLAEQLRLGPMWLGIALGDGFEEYGGGVHGDGCQQSTDRHAVVLIGHGREDGREYWLIRNSYSVGWGEAGYYKLAKDANCLRPALGFQFGTMNGVSYAYEHVPNAQNTEQAVRRRYADTA